MGVHCHTSIKMVVPSAVSWPDSQGWAGMPTAPSSWFANPMLGSKISRHIMPTATGVATSGSRMATRTHFSPRNGRQSSSAMPMPSDHFADQGNAGEGQGAAHRGPEAFDVGQDRHVVFAGR